MKRIEAKMELKRVLDAVGVKLKEHQVGLLDHLTDKVLSSTNPDGMLAEFSIATVIQGAHKRKIRRLVKLIDSTQIPITTGITESAS